MKITFSATGTMWQIDIYDENLTEQKQLTEQITGFVENFESNFSRFRDTSFVSKMAKKGGTYQIPKQAKKLLDFYNQLHEITDGLITPTIGKTLISAGYDKNYSLKPQANLSLPDNWKNILYDEKQIRATIPTQLDFGAAGKGYLVDLICDQLLESGLKNFCVDAGGDIKLVGKKQLTIGLENPSNTSMVIGTVNLDNNSFCGSSGNRRQWGQFNHLVNPKSLASPESILATWVLSSDCMVADGLATSLFFVKPNELEPHFDFEYLCLYSDFSIKKSKGLSAKLFI